MFNLLSSHGYQIDNSHNLNGYVTWQKLHDGIINFFTDSNIKPTDTLLFYYSGHGVPDVHGDVYFATSEIDYNFPDKRGFSFYDLAKMIQKTISSRVVVILDCCYSGSATLSKGQEEDAARLGTAAIRNGSRILQGEGRCLLASSQALQEAYFLEEENHSLFTFYVLQGLQGKDRQVFDKHGNITVNSLGQYVYDKVMSLSPEERPKQMPFRKMEGSGEIILIESSLLQKPKRLPKSLPKIKLKKEYTFETGAFPKELLKKTSITGKVTERTFYPTLIQMLKARGATAVSEVKYNSEPDIIFTFFGMDWILVVKIGETPAILTKAFLQYDRHKDESKIKNGILLFLPEQIRKTKPSEFDLAIALNEEKCTCLINTPYVKEETRNRTFTQILLRIEKEVIPAITRKETTAFPLNTVITFLQEIVSEMMQNIRLPDKEMLQVITDKKLLSDLGDLNENHSMDTARFLASYIVLSQILFLRLFSRSRPDILPPRHGEVGVSWLRTAFKHVLEINYRPIFEIDVLDSISETYLQKTFRLIWGLEIERIKDELPGRLFHALMPTFIRKMLAAFYTRPQAADLLARLTIRSSADTVFDPACGSGTILVSAYKRKHELYEQEGFAGNPHKRFCENEISGSDIMPFAVHLTTANLAAMDPSSTIDRTQIIRGDSLKLSEGYKYKTGVQRTLFPTSRRGYSIKGEEQEIDLVKVNVVLMNPPFTKIERGISKYIDMNRFGAICGNEIGLWGHFVSFADDFLEENGVFGGVIPISILRGRETNKIREFVLSNWTLLYVIKSTLNYGFSESAEYRDVLIVAKKIKPAKGHKIKFALLKKDLKSLRPEDISYISNRIELESSFRSEDLDIESFPIEQMFEKFDNLLWFCGVSDMKNRDLLVLLINKLSDSLQYPSKESFREGFRAVPEGASSFLFLTRNSDPCRKKEAFLFFDDINKESEYINLKTELGTNYQIEKCATTPSLRTPVGIKTMDITEHLDYLVIRPYKDLDKVIRASGFTKPKSDNFSWNKFWLNIPREVNEIRTHIVISRRINPYSLNSHLIGFYSLTELSPNNQMNVIKQNNPNIAKAFCVVINSIIFLSQFILLKEESTGRRIDIRFYDLKEMLIFPNDDIIMKLCGIFDQFSSHTFPSLREQLDTQFNGRYQSFWLRKRKNQKTIFEMDEIVKPSIERLTFDKAVCNTLNLRLSEDEIRRLYTVIVNEMIITLGLKKRE